ncbi:PREDICTED: uncharacterized protein LOC108685011 [Atta colombica]|uniref:uncharacterized protein LOC108685011 n=1 Tax=Atta colombica TaxID=520822 RepID=UPI00084BEA9F|nr:PREDICTED: uncharacterized protein LOC108685011 [Atta colombica]
MRLSVVFLVLMIVVCAMFQESESRYWSPWHGRGRPSRCHRTSTSTSTSTTTTTTTTTPSTTPSSRKRRDIADSNQHKFE